MDQGNNGISKMRSFFSSQSREITLAEFTTFWKSLSEAEKTEFRSATERWDGKSEFIPAAIAVPLALPASSMALATA